MSNRWNVCHSCAYSACLEDSHPCKWCCIYSFSIEGHPPRPSGFLQDKSRVEVNFGPSSFVCSETKRDAAAPKSKPRVGETITSLANALGAVSELLTKACEVNGGDWEGGRLKLPYDECKRKCVNSMMRHLLAEVTGELIDVGEGGLGLHHDVAIAANALIRVERRIREEPTYSWDGEAKPQLAPKLPQWKKIYAKTEGEDKKPTKEEQELYKKTDALAAELYPGLEPLKKPKVRAT